MVGLDNLSTVQDWFSDSLCRAATGEGDVRRALYTDGGLAVFAFRRVLLLNGIDVGALRGDLADRAIVVNLDRARRAPAAHRDPASSRVGRTVSPNPGRAADRVFRVSFGPSLCPSWE